ncbi:MAG: amidohydrolase family protein [Salinirussus sp.]
MLSAADRKDATILSSLSEVETVVDADAHVREDFEDLLPYIEDRYSGARRIVESVNCPRHELIQSSSPTPPVIGGEERYHKRVDAGEIGPDGDVVEPGEGIDVNDPRDRVQLQRAFGIDHSVLNPGKQLLAMATITNQPAAAALANAYNSWLLDTFLDETDGTLTGAAVVACQRPDQAAEEIDRMATEDDIVGVQLLASGHTPPLSDHRYDPIYEAAQDNGLPVMYHSATPALSRGFPMQHRWHEVYVENKVISHPFSHMWNLTKFLYQGLPVRFPDLDFVFQEAGVAWVPYMTWRLDDYYLQFSDQVPLLDRLPSHYVNERFYFTTQPLGHTARDPSHLAYAIEAAGPDSLMFASDVPHGDFDNPEELFDRVHDHFSAETVANIMGGTATDVFDF